MTDAWVNGSFGERVKSVRKARGIKSARELAAIIDTPNITGAILQNVEAGRKQDLTMSQVLNIAFGLRVPPSLLLAPMRSPSTRVDLPNLTQGLSRMTAREFDSWLTATPGAFITTDSADRDSRQEVQALREFDLLTREIERLRVMARLEEGSDSSRPTGDRLARAESDQSELRAFLEKQGYRP